jgi:aminocarboxymuconate-semialdehyde decarboxylase
MKIDISAHILPQKYVDAVAQKGSSVFQGPIQGSPTLVDLDSRFRIMDKYEDLVQVLTIASPVESPAGVAAGHEASELAKIANDAMAELTVRYPDRFIAAVAALPLSDMDAALKETDRAIGELKFKGVLINVSTHRKPIDGPEFMPLYQKMSDYNLPIWIHPWRVETVPDYVDEQRSMYRIWHTFGWVYETTVAMARLVFSGVLERYPDLKFITHHCGAMIPFFEQRIDGLLDYAETRLNDKSKAGLTKHILEYFRMFYNDTAINGSTPGLMCGYAFFDADHILFGTDTPFDSELGDRNIRETIRSIEEMDIPASDKKKIFEDNSRQLLRLSV